MSTNTDFSNGWVVYKRLLGYTRQHWVVFGLGILGFIINAQTEWTGAQLIKYIINAIQNHDQHQKNWIPVLVVGIFVIRGVGTFMGNYYISLVARHIVFQMRTEIFDKLLRMPASFYHVNSPGRITAKIVYDVEQVTAAATEAIQTLVREGFVVIGLFAYLFYTSWKLSLSLLIVGPVAGGLVRAASKRFRKLSQRVQASMGDVNHVAGETINGYTVVKTYGGEAYERSRFEKASREYLKQGMKIVVTTSVSTPLVQLLMAIAFGFVIWTALQPSIMGNIAAGEFVAYITAAGLLSKPVRALTDVNAKLQRGLAAAQSVFELLDLETEKDEGTREVKRLDGDIEFRHVGFAYDGGEPVLRDISLRARPGQTVALVGRSGSGKSTLVNLLPRFYEAGQGSILLDGYPIQDYRLQNLRLNIATVSQKVVLFDDTVANNIAYGAWRGASREQIEAAARAAYAHEFIEKLPEGYETRIGQDGVALSGGQRQRIAIARALLKDAPILILDEATSALDNESEFYIQSALDAVMRGRTTLVIAHRLSTIENADHIVVMDHGAIVESGSHAELLARNGVYAQLHSRRFEEEGPSGPVVAI
jgi:subfamily B ATP-binding cassette protein MsbA